MEREQKIGGEKEGERERGRYGFKHVGLQEVDGDFLLCFGQNIQRFLQ